MAIRAWLVGEPIDLDYLAQALSEGDVKVIKEGDKHYLTAKSIDNPPEDVSFHEEAWRLATEINGFARLREPACPAIDLTGSYSDEHGNVTIVGPTARLTARARLEANPLVVGPVVGPDGEVISPPSPREPQWIAAAQRDPDVGEVSRSWVGRSPTASRSCTRSMRSSQVRGSSKRR